MGYFVTKSLNLNVTLVDLVNNFMSNSPGFGLQRLSSPVLTPVRKRKECSKVHYDYDHRVPGVKPLWIHDGVNPTHSTAETAWLLDFKSSVEG